PVRAARLHSFPTRRSSDLAGGGTGAGRAAHRLAPAGLAGLAAQSGSGAGTPAPGPGLRAPLLPAGGRPGRPGRGHRAPPAGSRRSGGRPPAGALGFRGDLGAPGPVGAPPPAGQPRRASGAVAAGRAGLSSALAYPEHFPMLFRARAGQLTQRSAVHDRKAVSAQARRATACLITTPTSWWNW